MRRIPIIAVLVTIFATNITLWSAEPQSFTALRKQLNSYAHEKNARIGVAVIINGNDTIAINGDKDFPMLSVYKFPQALAIADYCQRNGISFNDTIGISASEIHKNTYSPLRDKYGVRDLRLPLSELLAYSLQLSDNNACDILFRLSGSTYYTDSMLRKSGHSDINVRYTEDEMHQDLNRCYINSATPLGMAVLLERFNTDLRHSSPEHIHIARLMETCATGTDRLVAPLMQDKEASILTIGHKTGTGDKNSQGNIIGINDVGYINFTDGYHYSIAVFISDSPYDIATTSSMIAEISELIYSKIKESRTTDEQ